MLNDIETTDNNFNFINVHERIRDLRNWYKEYELEDTKLEERVYNLRDSDEDFQKGQQIQHLRNILVYKIVKKPLVLDMKIEKDIKFSDLRQPFINQVVSLNKFDKQTWMYNFLFLMPPKIRDLHNKIGVLSTKTYLGQGKNFLLGGKSGLGKTTYLRWRASQSLPTIEIDRNIVPVILMDAPVEEFATLPIYQDIISAFGKTYCSDDNGHKLRQRIITYAQKCQLKLLMIDEVEHLITKPQRRKVLELSNWIRGVCIVCASCNPDNFANMDSELQGRFNDKITLEPYEGQDLSDLLTQLEFLLPFSEPSDLPFFEIKQNNKVVDGAAAFIAKTTKGILRDIMRLILDASLIAIEQNQSHISLDILMHSWKVINDSAVDTFDIFNHHSLPFN